MKRLLTMGIVVALLVCLGLPARAEARGKGWKDLMIGMGMGTAFGTVIGGATTLFLEPQTYQDAIFPVHYLVGAGIGLIIGGTGGAVIGWLPSDLDEEETAAGLLGTTGMFLWEMPLIGVRPVEVGYQTFEEAYFIYPLRLRF